MAPGRFGRLNEMGKNIGGCNNLCVSVQNRLETVQCHPFSMQTRKINLKCFSYVMCDVTENKTPVIFNFILALLPNTISWNKAYRTNIQIIVNRDYEYSDFSRVITTNVLNSK